MPKAKTNETDVTMEQQIMTEENDQELKKEASMNSADEESKKPESKTGDITTEQKQTSMNSADEESKKPESKTGTVVNSKFVRLRKSPSTDADVIGLLEDGETAEILEKDSAFYKIRTENNGVGYIASGFFEEDD